MSFKDRAAIVGIGETEYVRGAEVGSDQLMLQASRAAIADAGLANGEIDALVLPPVNVTAEQIAVYAGTYRLAGRDQEVRVVGRDGKLAVEGVGRGARFLLYQGGQEFRLADNAVIKAMFEVEGERAVGFTLHGDDGSKSSAKRAD